MNLREQNLIKRAGSENKNPATAGFFVAVAPSFDILTERYKE